MSLPSNEVRSDFQKAIDLYTVQFEPYLFQAQDALEHDNYKRTLIYCNKVLELSKEPEVQAAAWQLTAIAQFKMKFPGEMVRASFQSALSLDPDNTEIKQDYAFFELIEKADSETQSQRVHWHLIAPELLQKASINDPIDFQKSVFV